MIRLTGTLYGDLRTLTVSPPMLPRIRNVSDKYLEKSKQAFCGQYFFSEHRPVYEIMWKNKEWSDRQRLTI